MRHAGGADFYFKFTKIFVIFARLCCNVQIPRRQPPATSRTPAAESTMQPGGPTAPADKPKADRQPPKADRTQPQHEKQK